MVVRKTQNIINIQVLANPVTVLHLNYLFSAAAPSLQTIHSPKATYFSLYY